MRCLYCSVYPFPEREPGPCPRLYCCFLTLPPLSLHPLPSQISNCLNLGSQGRPWRLKEAHFLRPRSGGLRKALGRGAPTGSRSVTEQKPIFTWMKKKPKEECVVTPEKGRKCLFPCLSPRFLWTQHTPTHLRGAHQGRRSDTWPAKQGDPSAAGPTPQAQVTFRNSWKHFYLN